MVTTKNRGFYTPVFCMLINRTHLLTPVQETPFRHQNMVYLTGQPRDQFLYTHVSLISLTIGCMDSRIHVCMCFLLYNPGTV